MCDRKKIFSRMFFFYICIWYMGKILLSSHPADARRVMESGTFRIIENYLTQNSAEIEIYYGRRLDEKAVDRIIQIGSWLSQNTRDLTKFGLAELCGEIKKDLGIEVTLEELRYIIGIVMGIKDTRDPTGKTYLLSLMSEILNSDGSPSGNFALRNKVIHRDGLFHGSSNVAIFRVSDGGVDILLQTRAEDTFLFPGRDTLSACGHIDPGMNSQQTAVEETWQEISIEGQDLSLNPADIRQNLILIGKELGYDGYVRQYAFEYSGGDDLTVVLANLRQDLQAAGYLAEKKTLDSIFVDGFEDKNPQSQTYGKKWLAVYTFNPANENLLNEIKAMLERNRELSFDDSARLSPFNREKKSFYIYVLKNGDYNLDVIEQIVALQESRRPLGGGEVAGFKWVEFGTLLKEFRENPGRYTDAFFPFFSEPNIIREIVRILGQRLKIPPDFVGYIIQR